MDDGHRRDLVVDEAVGLVVEGLPVRRFQGRAGLLQQVDQLGKWRAQAVVAAGEKGVKEVGGVGIVGHPAVEKEVGLAGTDLFQVGAPVVGDNLGPDADSGQIGLEHLTHPVGVGEVGPADAHDPKGGLKAVGIACLGQQLLGPSGS